ncbi:MAG: transglycosylase SLT domain-containing protein [Bdellovibrionales bacterium]|nr:transglycosylase SLT domain-containing protein [Bdellovibrionales bacterium]
MLRTSTCLALLLGVSTSWAAGVTTVSVSLDQAVEAPRWMFDSKAKVKGGALIINMVEAKKALIAKDRAKCLSAIQKSYALGKSLGPWLVWNQLQCASLRDKSGRASVDALRKAIAKLESQPTWLLYGPSVPQLRTAYTTALLALAEEQLKSDRRSAWTTLDKLQQVRSWLTLDERANTYRWAGELAFIEQNLGAAQDFLLRSLSEKDSAELRTRVESIRSSLLGKKKDAAEIAVVKAAEKSADDLGISEEEKEIATRMNRAFDSQDFLSAIEDGVKLIQKFPGSKRASEAGDRVLEIYLSLSNRSEEKFRHVRDSAVKEMLKADAGRMSRWALNAYAKGNYQDALSLAEKAYVKYDGHPDSTKVLLLAAKAAVAAGEYDDARADYDKLLLKHGGTAEAAEGTFRMGLLEFRLKRYAQAAAYFERVLALNQGKDFEYRALYWQWRAQQKVDAAKSAAFAAPLIEKYPLSYYGLRAKAELGGGALELPDGKITIKTDLRLLESERLAWERFNILLKAGWFKEAERELDSLPEPQSNEERLLRAKFWAATLRYDNAIMLMNKAFDENPQLLQSSVLKIVFPKEYSPYIAREAKATGLNEDLIRSLIRQESSFRPEVKSPANALGVMQLLPSTAAEIARDIRLKEYTTDGLLLPETNIKLGSIYLSRLLKNFGGNMPLAVAAYNAGPTRLKRWLNARKDLSLLEAAPTSTPEAEVWIDELPWEETSHYVKSILRNLLIYRMLEGSKLSLSEPIWVDAKTVAR